MMVSKSRTTPAGHESRLRQALTHGFCTPWSRGLSSALDVPLLSPLCETLRAMPVQDPTQNSHMPTFAEGPEIGMRQSRRGQFVTERKTSA